jgi:hypothetical protein
MIDTTAASGVVTSRPASRAIEASRRVLRLASSPRPGSSRISRSAARAAATDGGASPVSKMKPRPASTPRGA